MEDLILIERLEFRYNSLLKEIKFQRENEIRQLEKGNNIEADCIKRIIEKLYDNLRHYSEAINHLKKIKTTSLNESEIEAIRQHYKNAGLV